MADNLETKTSNNFIKINFNLNKSTVDMINRWYPVLKSNGIVDNKTQTFTYLARFGEKILENYYCPIRRFIKLGKNIYIGEDLDNLKELTLLDESGNPVRF